MIGGRDGYAFIRNRGKKKKQKRRSGIISCNAKRQNHGPGEDLEKGCSTRSNPELCLNEKGASFRECIGDGNCQQQ